MDLGNGLNDGAGSKPWKEPPGLVVDEMMELVFVERPGDKSFFRDPIAKSGPEGKFGDGKIFISSVEEVYTISSGERETEPMLASAKEA